MKNTKFISWILVGAILTASFGGSNVEAKEQRVAGAGPGVVVVAAIVIFGLVYRIVQKNKERMLVDASGNRVELEKYEDIKNRKKNKTKQLDYIGKKAFEVETVDQCRQIAEKMGLIVYGTERVDENGVTTWICVFDDPANYNRR